ncbi:hypothetical protein [Nocardia sp. NPDC057440]|uniref:hypothetical protein n=1 Tax=Nocardia sp. NPDC057440 TaxID=3346134 RepID=UPI00367323B9
MLKKLAVAVLIIAGLWGGLAGTASARGNFLGRYYWLSDCLDHAIGITTMEIPMLVASRS